MKEAVVMSEQLTAKLVESNKLLETTKAEVAALKKRVTRVGFEKTKSNSAIAEAVKSSSNVSRVRTLHLLVAIKRRTDTLVSYRVHECRRGDGSTVGS